MKHPTVYNQNKDAWYGDEFDKNRVIMSII